MVLHYFGRGFNYSQDGPGNRLVYHLQGCNLKCPWCSNPEGMEISVNCEVKETDEIVNEIISCTPMFIEGGGVTFTGGEMSLQIDAVFEIMKKVKALGINTAVETNATIYEITKLIDVCDYWIIDYKHPDAQKFADVTGGSIKNVSKNILELSKFAFLHLRIPLIHSFNDDDEALEGFLDFFSSLKLGGGKFDIEILPYHEYGKEKWQKCGKAYTVENGFVTKETVNKFINKFKENDFTVIKT